MILTAPPHSQQVSMHTDVPVPRRTGSPRAANIDGEYPYMDSSWFASTLFDDLRYDCSRIFGLEGWHALMPGHDGYSRAGSQLFHRALSTRVFTGFAGAGPTCSPSVSVLCNRG